MSFSNRRANCGPSFYNDKSLLFVFLAIGYRHQVNGSESNIRAPSRRRGTEETSDCTDWRGSKTAAAATFGLARSVEIRMVNDRLAFH